MGDVVNFSRAAKKIARKDKEKRAADNRAFFGLTKAQKDIAKTVAKKEETALDAHKLDTPEDDSSKGS